MSFKCLETNRMPYKRSWMAFPVATFCEQVTNLFGSTPAAIMVKSYSFNLLWTMITTMSPEKTNTEHISEPIIRRFCGTSFTSAFRSHRSNFIDSFSFGKKRYNISQSFGAFFAQSCDWFLFPFYLSYFFSSFLIYSGWFFNKTIILLGLAGYRMIITNSALRASLVIYYSFFSAPS